MSLSNLNVIDAIGVDSKSGEMCLSVLDSWDWSDIESHLESLLEKINKYVDAVADGEIYELRNDAENKSFRIDVIFRFAPPERIVDCLQRLAPQAKTFGITLTWQTDHSSSSGQDADVNS